MKIVASKKMHVQGGGESYAKNLKHRGFERGLSGGTMSLSPWQLYEYMHAKWNRLQILLWRYNIRGPVRTTFDVLWGV